MRSRRKLSAHTHWHIFGAFQTSQWNYTRNMNLAHTVCAHSAVNTGHTQTHPGKPSHSHFRIRHSRQCDSLHDCVLYTFLKKKGILWIVPLCKNIWRGFSCFEYWGFWNLSNCHDCCVIEIRRMPVFLALKLPTSKTTFFLSFLFNVLLRAPAKLSPDYVLAIIAVP